jgi:hypothetical protein
LTIATRGRHRFAGARHSESGATAPSPRAEHARDSTRGASSGPTFEIADKRDSIILDVNSAGFSTSSVSHARETFVALSVPECGLDGQSGDPALPFKGIFVEIPKGTTPHLEVINDVASARPISARVYPKQPPAIDSVNTPPPFTLNGATYGQDEFLPAQPAEISRVGYMRGHQVVFIKAHPVQHNPARGELLVHQSLQLRIGLVTGAEAAGSQPVHVVCHGLAVHDLQLLGRLLSAPPSTSRDRAGRVGLAVTDPDGDPLTDTWSQLSGPTVVLSDAFAAKPTFEVPVVSARTSLVFSVSVGDGLAQSSANVTITVGPLPIAGTVTLAGAGLGGVTVSLGTISVVTDDTSGKYSYTYFTAW